jgi:hypothetical protein
VCVRVKSNNNPRETERNDYESCALPSLSVFDRQEPTNRPISERERVQSRSLTQTRSLLFSFVVFGFNLKTGETLIPSSLSMVFSSFEHVTRSPRSIPYPSPLCISRYNLYDGKQTLSLPHSLSCIPSLFLYFVCVFESGNRENNW